MDIQQAAQLLGVAPYTVLAVEHDGQRWLAQVRDMASHAVTARPVPGEHQAPEPAAGPELEVAKPPRKRAPRKPKKEETGDHPDE